MARIEYSPTQSPVERRERPTAPARAEQTWDPPLTPEELSFRRFIGTRAFSVWAEKVRERWLKKKLDSAPEPVQPVRGRK